jgi:hypothetical protein
VKISVGMVLLWMLSKILLSMMLNKTPYYQFKIKSIDDIETGSEKN